MSIDSEPSRRPLDDDVVPLPTVFRLQARACRDLGSPLSALLMDHLADDLDRSGPSAAAFARWPAARFGDLVGLRVLATAHRLVLERLAPELAIHYPSVGGVAPRPGHATAAGAAFVEVLGAHPDALARGMSEVPQTNETGRVVPLRHVLAGVGSTLPLRLRELGASAGLNLLADRLNPAGDDLELPYVKSRRGCDLRPVDITTTDGRLRLTSYVWPDDEARLERLRLAFGAAEGGTPQVVTQDAGQFVRGMRLEPASALVIWHSAMWFYLNRESRASILESISGLGAQAAADSPVVHAFWEYRGGDPMARVGTFALVVRRWSGRADDGVPMLWGVGPSHGMPFQRLDPVPLGENPLADSATD